MPAFVLIGHWWTMVELLRLSPAKLLGSSKGVTANKNARLRPIGLRRAMVEPEVSISNFFREDIRATFDFIGSG